MNAVEEQNRQIRVLIVVAAVIAAVMIGYNAFYVPDAPLSEPTVQTDLTPVSSAAEQTDASRSTASSALSSGSVSGKVNINTATAAELSEKLNGIGDGLAQRIVAYREKNGPFRSAEALKNVPGIGDKKYDEIRSSITVG